MMYFQQKIKFWHWSSGMSFFIENIWQNILLPAVNLPLGFDSIRLFDLIRLMGLQVL